MRAEPYTLFFQSVTPMPDYRLSVETLPGESIIFDFKPRLGTTRFADLRNTELFQSAATDGASIVFKLPGVMPVRVSAGEFLELLAKKPNGFVDSEERI